MTDRNPNEPMEDLPMWKIGCRHLLSPRTWIYPIIVLIIALFILPRLNRQMTTAPPETKNGETTLFGDPNGFAPAESTDAEGNIHRFAVPQPKR